MADHESDSGSPSLASLRIGDDARNGGASPRRWVWIVGTAVVCVVVVAFLLGRGSRPVVTVALATSASDAAEPVLLNASGYVTPRRRATVAAKITGRVIEVLVDEGMAVTAGQVLARLDDSDARARLAAAEAQQRAAVTAVDDLRVRLAEAEREMGRAGALQRDGIDSVQALDQARTAVESLTAQIALAKAQADAAARAADVDRQDLENYTIRAPFAGIAVSKDAQPGEMVSPVSAGGGYTRTGISTIVDMASLEIEVDVNEANIARVEPAQRVDAVLDAYPDWHIPAHVRTVIPTADRQKATVKVRIAFERLDPRILPDMGVKVSFLGEQTPAERAGRQAVVVPAGAVRAVDGQSVVFVVRDGRVERRAVAARDLGGGRVEVAAGLSTGESVVVVGPDSLRDGDVVEVESGGR